MIVQLVLILLIGLTACENSGRKSKETQDDSQYETIINKLFSDEDKETKDYLNSLVIKNAGETSTDMQSIFSNNIDTKGVMAECNRQLRIDGFEQSKKFIFDNISTSGSDFENQDYQNQKYQEYQDYQEIVKRWDKLIMNMFKAGIKGNVDLFNQVIEEANRLTLEENRILKNIIKE